MTDLGQARVYTSSAAGGNSRSDQSRRASNPAGRSIKRTLQRRKQIPNGNWCWVARGADALFCCGKPLGAGTYLGCRCSSSRRRGDGTEGRSVDLKQGRSRRQPRPGRRAETRGITSAPGKSVGVVETGGSGRSSNDGGDNRTLLEPRTRGLRWSSCRPEADWLIMPADEQEGTRATTKTLSNREREEGMRTWCLTSRLERAG